MTGSRGLRWRVPVGFALFLAGLVALLTRRWMQAGNFPPAVPRAAIILIVVLGVVVAWFGWGVRRYLRGNKADLNPIRAARSLALAQAGALTGAALIGLYAGQALGTSRPRGGCCGGMPGACSPPSGSWSPACWPSPGVGSRPGIAMGTPRPVELSVAHLSTSPTTKNIEPRTATMSAMRQPGRTSERTCTLLKDAERSLSRWGVFSPVETRK